MVNIQLNSKSIISESYELGICNSTKFVFVDVTYLHYITVLFISVTKTSKCGTTR